MSMPARTVAPRMPAVAPATPRRNLSPVRAPSRRRRPRPIYALIAVFGAVLIGAAQMVLSSMATEATFRAHELTLERNAAQLQSQELYEEVAGLGSPQNLGQHAAEMGLVIDAAPSYLRLSDNAVLGSRSAAGEDSTVDASARAAVGNLFLAHGEGEARAETEQGSGEATQDEPAAEPEEPPVLESGLPTPITH